jgi:hypothetical protein
MMASLWMMIHICNQTNRFCYYTYYTRKLRFSVSSPIMPPVVHTYDMHESHLYVHNQNGDDHRRYKELQEQYTVGATDI